MDILIKPILTEKMADLGERLNRYAFEVDSNANKIEIKNAIENAYGVNVKAVNTMKHGGTHHDDIPPRDSISIGHMLIHTYLLAYMHTCIHAAHDAGTCSGTMAAARRMLQDKTQTLVTVVTDSRRSTRQGFGSAHSRRPRRQPRRRPRRPGPRPAPAAKPTGATGPAAAKVPP